MDNPHRIVFRALAFTTLASLVLYGLGAISQVPPTGLDGFIPGSLEAAPPPASLLARLSPVLVLVYAFSFLPVVVLFTVAKFRTQPFGIILGSCLVVTSLLIEIINALPLTAHLVAHPRPTGVAPEVVLFMMQTDAVRFLALDVAGFTLAYVGLAVFAVVLFREHRRLARLIVASTLLFAANVPFLWVQPWMAVLLMVASIFAFAAIPVLLAGIAIRELSERMDSTPGRQPASGGVPA
ncbi:MAG: hypothetical protein IAE82_16335 [Opitutaceae bacterium]|nr:hypothetical protein [Opitutaceae bacterium]